MTDFVTTMIDRVQPRLFGWSELWRENGTGTRKFYVLLVPIFTQHFHHSTALHD